MCDRLLPHTPPADVSSWLDVHITDAGTINDAVFDYTSSRVSTTNGDNWE